MPTIALQRLLILLTMLLVSSATWAEERVRLHTNFGDIVVALNASKAPKSVDNFKRYVKEGFYDNTIFHRVIDGFMIQGGGFTQDYTQKPTHEPIENEGNNELKNTRGTLAMARTNMPHSATAQFFINVVDNDFLNYRSPTMQGWGYAVFGNVVEGMEVVDKIRKVPTGRGGPFPKDVPQEEVVILKATLEGAAAPAPAAPAASGKKSK